MLVALWQSVLAVVDQLQCLREPSTQGTLHMLKAMTHLCICTHNSFLGMGAYKEWPEEQRIAWLSKELEGKRPLIPADMPLTNEEREVCVA